MRSRTRRRLIASIWPVLFFLSLVVIAELAQYHPALVFKRQMAIPSEVKHEPVIEAQEIPMVFTDQTQFELTPGQQYLCEMNFYRNQESEK